MTNGEFTETLSSGGKLVVSAKGWNIQYYFPGLDRRYNGTFFRISGNDIDKYIDAWQNNFAKYLEYKKTLPVGMEFHTVGEMHMNIYVNRGCGYSGVCLTSYHMPVNDESKLKKIIEDYRNAKIRAVEIQNLLKTL